MLEKVMCIKLHTTRLRNMKHQYNVSRRQRKTSSNASSIISERINAKNCLSKAENSIIRRLPNTV
jgi:hypothetical protein